jgi:hypothetical protein
VAGYTLQDVRLSGDRLSFRVFGRSGEPMTRFAVTHTKPLHMFLFSTDLTDFRHVHPVMNPGGLWTLEVPDLAGGRYRVVVEFKPSGGQAASVMLGDQFWAAGERRARAVPPPAHSVRVGGYSVQLGGGPSSTANTLLPVRVLDRNGRPADLRPYLGSWGHAALVHADSLAVDHLHPLEEYAKGAESPAQLSFATPQAPMGTYRLIVEFATVTGTHQAEFTVSPAS